MNIGGGGQLTIGRNAANDSGYPAGQRYVQHERNRAFLGTFVGRSGAGGLLEVTTGGVFNQTGLTSGLGTIFQLGTADSGSSNGTLLIDGGTVNLNNIYFHGNGSSGSGASQAVVAGTSASHGTLTLTSGSLYLGSEASSTSPPASGTPRSPSPAAPSAPPRRGRPPWR